MRRLLCMLAVLLLARSALGADRKTELTTWLHQLADQKSTVRADARRELMGIANDELPLLRQIVVASSPLKPAEAEALEDIVTYVRSRYLLLQHAKSGSAFLGVSLGAASIEEADDDDRYDPVGVPIVELLPGFIAYRFLEEGDVILAMGSGSTLHPTRTREELITAVRFLPVGKVATMRILRGRSFVTISFPLDSALEATPEEVREFSDQAINEARRFWNEQFRPLIEHDAV